MRYRRAALHLLTVLSLLLCVATAVLWSAGRRHVWSWAPALGLQMTPEQQRARMDRFGTTSAEVQWSVRSDGGRFVADRYHYGAPALGVGTWKRWGVSFTERSFQAPTSGGGSVPGSIRSYSAPIWPLTLASAVLPVVAARAMVLRRRERARRQQGLCPSCGYDLRATPGRCPECGVEPDSAGVGNVGG